MNLNYLDLFRLDGKTAIVTGGLGIIGKKCCIALAQYGANVVIVDLHENEAKQFAKQLTDKFGNSHLGIECDVSSKEEVENMVKTVCECYGEIHILHNNAATKTNNLKSFYEKYENYSLDSWRQVMAVNIDGMFLVSQAVGKKMRKQKTGGSIIQTSSIYGLYAPDHRIYENANYLGEVINTPAVYTASKSAVIGLTKYLATYWAKDNIRVNTITLGGMESGQNKEFIEKYSNRVPLGRMGRVDEMIGALIFLASDASSYMTGQNIIIDGGLSTW